MGHFQHGETPCEGTTTNRSGGWGFAPKEWDSESHRVMTLCFDCAESECAKIKTGTSEETAKRLEFAPRWRTTTSSPEVPEGTVKGVECEVCGGTRLMRVQVRERTDEGTEEWCLGNLRSQGFSV